jgi:hypothetical protein
MANDEESFLQGLGRQENLLAKVKSLRIQKAKDKDQ